MKFGIIIQWTISLAILCVILIVIIFFIIQLGRRDRAVEMIVTDGNHSKPLGLKYLFNSFFMFMYN